MNATAAFAPPGHDTMISPDTASLREVVNARGEYAEIIGKSESLRYVLYRMERVAPHRFPSLTRAITPYRTIPFRLAPHARRFMKPVRDVRHSRVADTTARDTAT
ncbi:hypothetical protein PLCT1_00621 [Planctomycetaceae bacterium]|nr:hypothetical protein PLCT1_00621 [Planctomycetaceae bacterium]